jgi:hypothetical protein
MDHATANAALLATHFATSLFPLTVRLIPVIAQFEFRTFFGLVLPAIAACRRRQD